MADGIMVDIHLASNLWMVGRLRSLMKVHLNRSVMLIPLSVLFVPLSTVPTYFDRNASLNFILLCLTSIVCAGFIFKFKALNTPPAVAYLLIALVIGTAISGVINVGKINMLTGDTGRSTGLISLYALLLIALSYTQIKIENFQWHLRWILIAVLIVDIFGAFQYLNIYLPPTGAGIGSTLGNSNFFSAWLGTSIPLILLFKYPHKQLQLIFQTSFIALTISLMWVIDVKQGFVDLILLIGLITVWKFRSLIKSLDWGVKFWTAAISFATIVWFEIVFLLPMAKVKIPFFTDDIQVTIRTHFWNAGMQMFFDHIPFGVGPDNYGNYYEQYRSLDSFKITEYVLSNDAHSSIVQSFATLGLVNVLIFTALWVLLIRSLVINIFKRPEHKNTYLLLGAYFLIFATNSMISPITLPSKFIFWALAGFVVGSAAVIEARAMHVQTLKALKAISALMTVVVAFVAINFSIAQLSFATALTELKKDPKQVRYDFNPYLPCVIYFQAQLDLAAISQQESKLQIASEQIKNNERCLNAQMFMAETAIANQDWQPAKLLVSNILEIAPARREVISIAAVYALKSGDKELQKRLVAQGEFLGLINATGSVPQSQPK